MKLYFLNNMYCQSTQAGIQALHAGIRLVKEYENSDLSYMISDWYNNHETVVILNAGNSTDLDYYLKLLTSINTDEESIPYSYFTEPGLNDSITSVAVLCSTEMVEDMKDMREKFEDTWLMERLSEKYGPSLFELLSAMSRMRTI